MSSGVCTTVLLVGIERAKVVTHDPDEVLGGPYPGACPRCGLRTVQHVILTRGRYMGKCMMEDCDYEYRRGFDDNDHGFGRA